MRIAPRSSEPVYSAYPKMTIIVMALAVIVIIMMLVTSENKKTAGLFIYTPKTRKAADLRYAQYSDVVLRIRARSKYPQELLLNGQRVALEQLALSLKNIFKQRAYKELYVSAEDEVSWEAVISVVDVARGADPDIRCILIHKDQMTVPPHEY